MRFAQFRVKSGEIPDFRIPILDKRISLASSARQLVSTFARQLNMINDQ